MWGDLWFSPSMMNDFADVEFTDIDDARAEIERTLRKTFRTRAAIIMCSTEKELDIIRKVLNDKNKYRQDKRYACLASENLQIPEHLRIPCHLHKYIVA